MTTSQYVHGNGVNWRQYLQAREFEASLHENLSDDAARMVASREEIDRYIVRATTVGSQRLQEVGAVFSWGFAEVLVAIEAYNHSLPQPLEIAGRPSYSWAYEQFNIARDTFRRGLYPESLRHVRLATAGHGQHLGYELDFRFYYLEGVLLLGSFENVNSDVINPAASEETFLKAVRYASTESSADVARALLGASQAAYIQGKVSDSLKHALRALSTASGFPEAHFQVAKCLMHQGDHDAARPHVMQAIVSDAEYALKMLTDGDFRLKHEVIVECIETYARKVSSRLDRRCSTHERALVEIANIASDEDRSLAKQCRLSTKPLTRLREDGTLMGWLSAEREYHAHASSVSLSTALLATRFENDAVVLERFEPGWPAAVAGLLSAGGIIASWCYGVDSRWIAPKGCLDGLLLVFLMVAVAAATSAIVFKAVAALVHAPKASRARDLRSDAQRLKDAAGALQ